MEVMLQLAQIILCLSGAVLFLVIALLLSQEIR